MRLIRSALTGLSGAYPCEIRMAH